MRKYVSAVAIGLLVLCFSGAGAETPPDAPPECPKDATGYAGQIKQLFKTEIPISDETLQNANALENLCGTDFFVLYSLADAWYELLLRDGATLEQQTQIANRGFGLLLKAENLPYVNHNYDVAVSLRQKIVNAVVQFADAGGSFEPYLSEGAQIPACDNSWSNVSQNIWYAYKSEWTGDARPALITNVSRSCGDQPRLWSHVYFAQLRIGQADRETDPTKKLALMDEAREVLAAYTGDDRHGLNWDTADQDAFDRDYEFAAFAVAASRPRLARKDWFKPENLQSGATRQAIALTANELWGPHYTLKEGVATKDEFAAQYRGYSAFVSDAYEEAKATGREAQTVLFEALRDHASGKLRTAESKDRPMAFGALYVWTDPDYVPPVTPTD